MTLTLNLATMLGLLYLFHSQGVKRKFKTNESLGTLIEEQVDFPVSKLDSINSSGLLVQKDSMQESTRFLKFIESSVFARQGRDDSSDSDGD